MPEIQHSQAARSILTYSATPIISKGAYVTRPLLADLHKGKRQNIIIIIIIIMQVDILKLNS
jgi:hypothetical protein